MVQGAPEVVLSRCTHGISNAGGNGTPFVLTPALRATVLQQVEEMGSTQALRCLALAYRSMPPTTHQARSPSEVNCVKYRQ